MSAQAGLRRTARIDPEAVLANALDAAAALSGTPSTGGSLRAFAADLRADAYGHGALRIASRLGSAGIGALLVSRPEDERVLGDAGAGVRVVAGSRWPEFAEQTGLRLLGGHALFADEKPGRPTMRLSAEVLSVKSVAAGSGVSYGYTYRTARRTRLALVGLGFADGIPRAASNRAPVRIRGFTGRISGRVAMDQFVVDLGDATASVGDEAVLFGSPERGEPSLGAWASATGLDPLVLLARLGPRIHRAEVRS